MENKNNKMWVFGITFLIVGFLGGWLMRGNNQSLLNPRTGIHMMPNGGVMSNTGSMSMSQMMIDMNAELQGKKGDNFDKAFMIEMIVHHEGAVQMAELALKNAKHQEIKDLAKGIVSAQNKEIGEMKGWLQSWYGIGN